MATNYVIQCLDITIRAIVGPVQLRYFVQVCYFVFFVLFRASPSLSVDPGSPCLFYLMNVVLIFSHVLQSQPQ